MRSTMRAMAAATLLMSVGGAGSVGAQPTDPFQAEIAADAERLQALQQGVLAEAARDPRVIADYEAHVAQYGPTDFYAFVDWHARTVGGANTQAAYAAQLERERRLRAQYQEDQPNSLTRPSNYTSAANAAALAGGRIEPWSDGFCYYIGTNSHGQRAPCPGD